MAREGSVRYRTYGNTPSHYDPMHEAGAIRPDRKCAQFSLTRRIPHEPPQRHWRLSPRSRCSAWCWPTGPGHGSPRVLSREGVWLKHENFFYNIRTTDEAKGTVSGVNVYEFARNPFRMQRRISAKSAKWTGKKWVAENAELRDIGADHAITEKTLAEYAITGLPPPEELMTAETSYKNMNFAELNAYIEELDRDGFDTLKYRLELYNKISLPLVNFIMALIAIPFAVRGGRHGSVAASMSIAIMVAFSYWIISGFSAHLGQNAILPPLVSAFMTDALFVATGGFMLRKAR